MNISNVWTEKYRPQDIKNVVLDEENLKYFSELSDIPNNLLFIGNPGIGKTTVAKILAKQFAPNSYIYINASEQGNIDTVRNLISDFISVSSIDGKQKIIILDEADGISLVAQQALRSVMEEFLDNCKFILTANYKNKLIEAIRSRCQEFTFSCSENQVLKRVVEIIKAEKINVPKFQVENLKTLVKMHYPDIRKTLNEIQKASQSGTFTFKAEEHSQFFIDLKGRVDSTENVFDIREYVNENSSMFNNDYHFLMKQLYKLFIEVQDVKAVLNLTEHMYRHSFVVDPEVNFTACLFNLRNK
jgi:replication factor C small subunit